MANNMENCIPCKKFNHWIEIRLVDENAKPFKGKLNGTLRDNNGTSYPVTFQDGYLLQKGLSAGPVRINLITDELLKNAYAHSSRKSGEESPVPAVARKQKGYAGSTVKYQNITVGDIWASQPKRKIPEYNQPGATGKKLILIVDNSYLLEVRTIAKKENIILIGSEVHNKSFWTQMMFIAAATHKIKSGLRQADNNVVAIVSNGYTNMEIGILETYKDRFEIELMMIQNQSQMVSLLNRDRENTKIQDLYFYTHGYPGTIDFNMDGYPKIKLNQDVLSNLNADSFAMGGIVHSFACRTGMKDSLVLLNKKQFSSDAEAAPEKSLAMQMAKYFNVQVRAFLTRTFYRHVLRDFTKDSSIEKELKKLRETKGDYVVYKILDEYDALPHAGISDGWTNFGAKSAGTDGYVLWPRKGGRLQPVSDDTPKGLTKGERIFKPEGE